MKPRAKMIVSSIFLRVAICSPQIIGIGRRIIIKSVAMLKLLRAIREAKGLSQTPGWRGFHVLESGRQVKISLTNTATPKVDTKTMTAYAILRKILFERKIVM